MWRGSFTRADSRLKRSPPFQCRAWWSLSPSWESSKFNLSGIAVTFNYRRLTLWTCTSVCRALGVSHFTNIWRKSQRPVRFGVESCRTRTSARSRAHSFILYRQAIVPCTTQGRLRFRRKKRSDSSHLGRTGIHRQRSPRESCWGYWR